MEDKKVASKRMKRRNASDNNESSFAKLSKKDTLRNCSFCGGLWSKSELNSSFCAPCGLQQNAKFACGSEDCQTVFNEHIREHDAGFT